MVLLEKLCFLTQNSLKYLSLQAAMHTAHGAVIDTVSPEFQYCTGEREGSGPVPRTERSPKEGPFGQQPQLPDPSFSGPPILRLPSSAPRPGYGENGHESYVPCENRVCPILENPVRELTGEERNGHFPWRGRGGRGQSQLSSLSRSVPSRGAPSPIPLL